MGWLSSLAGNIVALDAAPLIYFIERKPGFHGHVRPFFKALRQGDFEVVTSAITVTEVLVHPLKNGNAALADEFRELFLETAHFRTISVTPQIAEIAANRRAEHGIRTPDALHMATAMHCDAKFLLTNDGDFPDLPRLKVLRVSDL